MDRVGKKTTLVQKQAEIKVFKLLPQNLMKRSSFMTREGGAFEKIYYIYTESMIPKNQVTDGEVLTGRYNSAS